MATTKKTKPQTFKAEWNARINGNVQQISVIVTKKDGKYYNEDGNIAYVPDHAKITAL